MKVLIVSLLLVISCVANNGGDDGKNNGNSGNSGDWNSGNGNNNGNSGNSGDWNSGNGNNNGHSGDDNNNGHSGNSGDDNNYGNSGHSGDYSDDNSGHSGDYSDDNNGHSGETRNTNNTNIGNNTNSSNNSTQQDCNTCQERTQIEQFLADTSVYVAKVKILSKIDNSDGKYKDNLVRFRAQVLNVYNGCLKVKKCPIVLETSLDATSCGRPLDDFLGEQFVISFRTGSTSCKNSYAFGLCDLYVSSDLLTDDDMFLLENWKNDCLGVCSTGTEVQCLVAPCETAIPPNDCDIYGATCTDNYCNGCNALWWNDDGTLRCHSGILTTLSNS
jgi:hypothetical protein